MGVYDQAARYTAKLDSEGFFAWLLPGLLKTLGFMGWLDTRTLPFPGESDRTCDTVAHFRENAPEGHERAATSWAVPVEFQSEPDAKMLERLLEYAIRLRRELRPSDGGLRQYEVAAAVLNLTGGRQSNRWQTGLPQPSVAALTWAVELRTMAEEDARGLLAEIDAGRFSRCLLAWVPLMQDGDEPELIETWKQVASKEPNSRLRSDYGALALIFAELAGRAGQWKFTLQGWNMKESQQVLEWQEEARQEGRQEGRESALRENLFHVLEVRFQAEEIPQELRAHIGAQSDLATLNRWFDLALTAEDLEAFRRGL